MPTSPWLERRIVTEVCQFVDPSVADEFPCEYRESGGYRCERLDPHGDDGHWWSEHTIQHSIAGNGYACSAFTGDGGDPAPLAGVLSGTPAEAVCRCGCPAYRHTPCCAACLDCGNVRCPEFLAGGDDE